MRRSRFTVAFASGEPQQEVILAFTSAQAKHYFESRGRAVASVRKGDFRFSPPPGESPGRIDMQAFREAQAMLGLKLPVSLRGNARQGGAFGRQRTVHGPGGWGHEIMVKSTLGAEQMGRTLWHELAHCLQVERDVLAKTTDAREAYRMMRTLYFDGTTYLDKPWEVEAREHESLNDDLPLAR